MGDNLIKEYTKKKSKLDLFLDMLRGWPVIPRVLFIVFAILGSFFGSFYLKQFIISLFI